MCGNVDIAYPKSSQLELIQRIAALPQEPIEVTHRVQDGLYTRRGKVSAGKLIVGCKHRAKNIFHLSKGKVIVWDKFHGTRTLEAPYSEMTIPGTQRLGFTITEIEGCNLFETAKTNVEDIEREMLYPLEVETALQEIAAENFLKEIENHAQ